MYIKSMLRLFPLLVATYQSAVTPQVSTSSLFVLKKMVDYVSSVQIKKVVTNNSTIVEGIADVISSALDREVGYN